MPSTTWSPSSRPDLNGDVEARSLAERLGHAFTDESLLRQAMAHRSWCAETPGTSSNERLEFLGDAVLGLVVTDHLFRSYPGLAEGELAKVRASVVNAGVLAEVAGELGIGEALSLGKGEDASGGREKPSILSDAMEAVIGAVYLDGGWEAADQFVMALLGGRIREATAGPGGQDYKTRLQEVVGRRIKQVDVSGMRSIRRHPNKKHFAAKLEGRKLTGVERRGKYLVVRLEGGDVLAIHLGMSGQLLRAKGGGREKPDKHTHVVITFTQGGKLVFVDPRTFGEMFVTTPEELEDQVPELAHLGFDPVDDMMSWTDFGEK